MVKEKTRAASSRRVKELIGIAKRAGLKTLRVGEIEFEFATASRLNQPIDNKKNPIETDSEAMPMQMPTDEEFLNWSTPHFDQIQAAKSK